MTIDDRDDMQAQIEMLREERLYNQAQSLAMYAQTNKRWMNFNNS